MDAVECELIRWVSDDPQPGLVEVRVTDANGSDWKFVDKVPIFTAIPVSSATPLPLAGGIRCKVLGARSLHGREVVDVELLDGVASVDGESRLIVRCEQLFAEAQGQ